MNSDILFGMKNKIAYCGIEGAFANIAAKKIFPLDQLISYPTFTSAYKAVENGECDFAVLPMENSFAGDVSQVFDLMFTGTLFISQIFKFKIAQTLLGIKGAKIDDIKTVYSHQQAIDQCCEFIQKNGFVPLPAVNTAVAAKEVAQKNDKTIAAIASEEAGILYGLEILVKNINQTSQNTTRFAVFSKQTQTDFLEDDKVVSYLMFAVKNVPGALSAAIKIISKKGFNLISLHSHPIKDVAWEYYFYAEVEGSLFGKKGQKLIEKLKKGCSLVKIVGQTSEKQEEKQGGV